MPTPRNKVDLSLWPALVCPRCGSLLDVVSPPWLRVEWNLQKGRLLSWGVAPHPPDLCLDCTIASLTQEQRAAWQPVADKLLSAREQVYRRPDVTLYHVRFIDPPVHRKVGKPFQLDMFYLPFEGSWDDTWRVPILWIVPDTGQDPFGLLMARHVLSLEGVAAEVVVTWNMKNFYDDRTKFELVNWEDCSQRDLRRLMDGGVTFAKQLPRGRPRGTTLLSLEECVERYRIQVRGGPGRPLNVGQYCERADISVETFRGWLKSWDMTWTKFRQEAERS